MTPQQRKTVIENLVADKVAQLSWDNDFKTSLLMDGFQGFGNMNDSELIQCAVDAGLTENTDLAFINN